MELVKAAKTNLRINLKKKLSLMTANEITEQSKIITNKLLSHPAYKRSNRVSIYLSMDSEVQTYSIVKNIFDSGKICFIPKYNKSEMSMVKIKSIGELNSLPKTKWNISQPADDDVCEDALATGGLDLIIVPGLGFTTDGKRLGRGKGYYDRCITEYKNKYPLNNLKTIGLAFSEQICEDIPTNQQDSLIDFLVYP
ncbi:5-formyltetrahydrofolate cyclo-ligase [Rhopalosiphum maidis]|uniref:5-formyltetrahydrofolate cyclo-ligase n=1 Tax=Rhopalosiphum maidis TaxID=43146 RepID=UPI000EFF760E|nr:5-formyltetrahydrofolate cyclo-ligase [Rhopalosiphum maidis]XP_026812539.1 5-formyltetrahydrofolate cyclo-ligase [Rhopalosiphum maidis]XP_026812540.1 5-formyltetrahydrofolate cyclo-ligase [Rhopalosiphum maidis]XP_026812541.1 5-formyltetrahydrofolate cyclo-ligase [Rhopalosiphum maidis]